MNDFLPEGYVTPTSNNGYMKFAKGENKFRFITSPITGYVWFVDNGDSKSVFRVRMTDPLPHASLKAKHFWAALVYNYDSLAFQILEITQKTIMAQISNLNANKSWGNPKDYDLIVVRTGDGMETEYNVMPEPKSEQPIGSVKFANEINLEALFEGGDPFEAK